MGVLELESTRKMRLNVPGRRCRGSATEPLLERAQGRSEASSSGTQQQILATQEAQARFEAGAQKVVMWTVWLLLGSVMLGTVIGVVVVSGPLQRGDPPPGAFPAK